jgi:hypothetical protein
MNPDLLPDGGADFGLDAFHEAHASRIDRFFILGVLKLEPVCYRATERFHIWQT